MSSPSPILSALHLFSSGSESAHKAKASRYDKTRSGRIPVSRPSAGSSTRALLQRDRRGPLWARTTHLQATFSSNVASTTLRTLKHTKYNAQQSQQGEFRSRGHRALCTINGDTQSKHGGFRPRGPRGSLRSPILAPWSVAWTTGLTTELSRQWSLVIYFYIRTTPEAIVAIGLAESKVAYPLHATSLFIDIGCTIASFNISANLAKDMSGFILLMQTSNSSPEIQLQRLMARAKSTFTKASARLTSKQPTSSKIASADIVINNSGSRSELEEQVRRCLKRLERTVGQT
ncbi:hypothetical protein BKA82DRAFT_28113 [Pisolithus tinctorius]|uniref:Dephospho-CoA kinase n=1 Tax=Pisolithus tinctorius Marx 270 TaxID=870435 RepID=A0A0C3IZG6_PISTI|nr:hypothetical protein BKA82DRAFT_28113 [Pisolithus tinctorius]KIO02203.1 hypothetical protein M404DRAFT_28113 [Pisolithus tinctorius Marx 270]